MIMTRFSLVRDMAIIEGLECTNCGWGLSMHGWPAEGAPCPPEGIRMNWHGGFRLGHLSVSQTEAIDRALENPKLSILYIAEWVAFLKRLFRTPHKVCDDYD